MVIEFSKRAQAHAQRARAVVTDLLDSLGATTSYAERSPRRREKVPWRALYGWELAFQAKPGALLDADGKPTQIELVRKFSHDPGDIITSRQVVTELDELGVPHRRNKRYMVQPDHSLRRI